METSIPRTVGEIMIRDVKTLPAEATLQEAAMLLNTCNISGAPVIDETHHLVGIVSESDLLNRSKREAALPRTAVFGIFLPTEDRLRQAFHEGTDLPVTGVMTRDVITVTPETTINEAGDLMLKRGINRLPVVEDGRLVGIVTREDLLRAVYHLPS